MKTNIFKGNNIFFIIFISIFILTCIPSISYGNAAEPPSILIIVPNAPNDLEISMEVEGDIIKARKTDKIIEKYYTFYRGEMSAVSHYKLNIKAEDIDYQLAIDEPVKSYNNIYSLDLDSKTITPGKLPLRSAKLVGMRVILTLMIEAMIFWMFAFRDKKSWIAFLVINLITQGGLNIWLNGFSPVASYIVLSLIFGEIIIFIVEAFSFSMFVKEHSNLRKILYVLLANILSLVAGGYIITMLPV